MIPIGHTLGAALYLAAALLGARPGVDGGAGSRGGRGVLALLAAGAVSHAVGFVGFHLVSPPVPLESVPAALSLIGWLVASAYLASLRLARVSIVGPWVAAAAFAFTLLAEIGLRFFPATGVSPSLSGAWPHAHVLLGTAGFSLLALASLGGLAYLAKERALKRKRQARVELPSLESLDRIGHLGLALGFPLLTLGCVTGFVWAARAGQSPWSGHALLLLVAWGVYALPVALRVGRGVHGQAPARSAVIGFLVLAFSYLGVRLLGAAT